MDNLENKLKSLNNDLDKVLKTQARLNGYKRLSQSTVGKALYDLFDTYEESILSFFERSPVKDTPSHIEYVKAHMVMSMMSDFKKILKQDYSVKIESNKQTENKIKNMIKDNKDAQAKK